VLQSENSYYNQRRRIKALHKITEPPYTEAKPVLGYLTLSDPFSVHINDSKDFLQLRNIVIKETPRILILDPLVNFHSVDENDNAAMGQVMKRLRSLINEFDISVILVHHTRKPGQKESETGISLRGASSIFGAADTVLLLSMSTEIGKTLRILSFNIRNGEPVDPLYLDLDPEILWFMKSGYKMRLAEWLIDTLIKAREDGIKQADLVKIAADEGYGSTRTKEKIRIMIEQGTFKTDKEKRRSSWYHTYYRGIPF